MKNELRAFPPMTLVSCFTTMIFDLGMSGRNKRKSLFNKPLNMGSVCVSQMKARCSLLSHFTVEM